jgi:hypothetical protein
VSYRSGSIPTLNVLSRSTPFDEPGMVAEVPEPGDEFGPFLIYTDESGTTTWNFALDESNRIDVTRGGGTRTNVIPRIVPPPQARIQQLRPLMPDKDVYMDRSGFEPGRNFCTEDSPRLREQNAICLRIK